MIPTSQTHADEHPHRHDPALAAEFAHHLYLTEDSPSETHPEEMITEHCGSAESSELLEPDFLSEGEHERLLKSFDMIFRLHQRSEEIRSQLEKIDAILLGSRTVYGLTETLVQTLEKDLDLVSVRLLLREGHPMASALRLDTPAGAGIIRDDFMEHEAPFRSDAFVLDDPAGELAGTLFGDSVSVIASAAVAYLGRKNEDLGLLCLGSDDPSRYCGNMNTDLILKVANKITLGFCNAWDHESAIRSAIETPDLDIYSDQFFQAYLRKEFARAWRNHSCFSLMAISAEDPSDGSALCNEHLVNLLKSTLRASDLVAHGDWAQFWALLPDTDADEAKCAARRLVEASSELSQGNTSLRIGITEFSRNAPTRSAMLRAAREALQEAVDIAEPIVIGSTSATG